MDPDEEATAVRRVLFAVLLTVTGAGCDSGADSICTETSEATLCLVPDSRAYRLEGRDFAPGSEFQMSGGEGAPRTFSVGPDGRIPAPGSAVGFLPGPEADRTQITATSSSGQPVIFTIVCDARGDGSLCTPRFD